MNKLRIDGVFTGHRCRYTSITCDHISHARTPTHQPTPPTHTHKHTGACRDTGTHGTDHRARANRVSGGGQGARGPPRRAARGLEVLSLLLIITSITSIAIIHSISSITTISSITSITTIASITSITSITSVYY